MEPNNAFPSKPIARRPRPAATASATCAARVRAAARVPVLGLVLGLAACGGDADEPAAVSLTPTPAATRAAQAPAPKPTLIVEWQHPAPSTKAGTKAENELIAYHVYVLGPGNKVSERFELPPTQSQLKLKGIPYPGDYRVCVSAVSAGGGEGPCSPVQHLALGPNADSDAAGAGR